MSPLPTARDAFQPLLECVGPVPPSAGVVCTDTAGNFCSGCLSVWGMYPIPRASSVPTPRDAHSVRFLSLLEMLGACTPFRECRLYRPCGTLSQPLLECAGPVPPSAGVVCTDPAGRSVSCLHSGAARVRGACIPFRGRRMYRPRGTLFSRCWSAWGLYPLPRASSVPTPRDAELVVCILFAAYVRGACIPFRGRRLYQPHGTPFSRCLSAWGLYPLPRALSVPTPQDAPSVSHSVAA